MSNTPKGYSKKARSKVPPPGPPEPHKQKKPYRRREKYPRKPQDASEGFDGCY